jgi:hypothetical protein
VVAVVRRDGGGRVAIHLVNRDHDAAAKRIRPAKEVAVAVPRGLIEGKKLAVIAPGVAAGPVEASMEGDRARLQVPALAVWAIVTAE